MALDLDNKDMSTGQVVLSTYDIDDNAIRVNVVASSASSSDLVLIDTVYNDYSSTPVTTAAYVTLIASLPAAVKQVEIFDSSGSVLTLALGAAAAEVDINQVIPGGNGLIPCVITAAARLSIKAVSANASSGLLVINLYG